MNNGFGEVDNILLQELRNLGIGLGENVRTLSDLSSDLVLKSVERCLNAIGCSKGSVFLEMPNSVSARYSRAAMLAEECVKIGYPSGHFGHQTFLQGDQGELRDVFQYLLDRIHKGRDESQRADGKDDDPWKDDEVPKDLCDMDVNLLPRESRNAAFNLIQQTRMVKQNLVKREMVESSVAGIWNESEDEDKVLKDCTGSETTSECQEEVAATQLDYKRLRDDVMKLRKEVRQLSEEDTSLNEALEKRERLLQLLPSGQENLQRLRARVTKSERKLEDMEKQYELARRELEKEYEELLAKGSLEQEDPDLFPLREIIRTTELKLKQEKALHVKYDAAVRKMDAIGEQSYSRSQYTGRIQDLQINIGKQTGETTKVIQDIRQTQKDINLLEGKLYRTYAEADLRVFEVSKRDHCMQPAYKGVTELHKTCADIVETVGKAGKVKRANKDSNDQLEIERTKELEVKMEKLRDDLNVIKVENEQIRERLLQALSTT